MNLYVLDAVFSPSFSDSPNMNHLRQPPITFAGIATWAAVERNFMELQATLTVRWGLIGYAKVAFLRSMFYGGYGQCMNNHNYSWTLRTLTSGYLTVLWVLKRSLEILAHSSIQNPVMQVDNSRLPIEFIVFRSSLVMIVSSVLTATQIVSITTCPLQFSSFYVGCAPSLGRWYFINAYMIINLLQWSALIKIHDYWWQVLSK